MSASIPVDVQAVDMSEERLGAALNVALELAWNNNVTITVVGEAADALVVLCPDGDCFLRPGVVVVCPDVDLIQLGHAPEGSEMVERPDGRSAAVFPGVTQ